MNLFLSILTNLARAIISNLASIDKPLSAAPASLPDKSVVEKVLTFEEYMLMMYRKFGGEISAEFPEGPYIFGVRNEADIKEELWNDIIGVIYEGTVYLWMGTTDPSAYYTRNPLNPAGTAHIKCGFHKGVWRLGKHTGKYAALVNDSEEFVGPFAIWRDKNSDFMYSAGEDSVEVLGANLHHGWSTTGKIGVHGASCQVIRNKEEFLYLMSLIQKSRKVKTLKQAARFDYMLFDKSQVIYDELVRRATTYANGVKTV